MRTVLATLLLANASLALAHEGHGAPGLHGHGADLLSLLAMAVGVGLWLWRRGRP